MDPPIMDDYDFGFLDFDPDWAPSQEVLTGVPEPENDYQLVEQVGLFTSPRPTASVGDRHVTGWLPNGISAFPYQVDDYSLTASLLPLGEDSVPSVQYAPQNNANSASKNPAPTSSLVSQEDRASTSQLSGTPAGDRNHSKFFCKVPGCKNKGFLRKRDLAKHMKKHTKEDVYDCPSVGCSRTGDRAHCIRDQFIDHLRRGHKGSATTWRCPLESCNGCFQQLEELAEHLRGSHGERRCSQKEKVVSAILKAGST